MQNKLVQLTNGRVVVDGSDVGEVVETRPASPALFDTYSQAVAGRTVEGAPTGETIMQYFLWNGHGWAQITGEGEQVTIHE